MPQVRRILPVLRRLAQFDFHLEKLVGFHLGRFLVRFRLQLGFFTINRKRGAIIIRVRETQVSHTGSLDLPESPFDFPSPAGDRRHTAHSPVVQYAVGTVVRVGQMFGRRGRVVVVCVTVVALVGPDRVGLGVPALSRFAVVVDGTQPEPVQPQHVGPATDPGVRLPVLPDGADQHPAHGRRVVGHRLVELVARVLVLPAHPVVARFQRRVTAVGRLRGRRGRRGRRRHRVRAAVGQHGQRGRRGRLHFCGRTRRARR